MFWRITSLMPSNFQVNQFHFYFNDFFACVGLSFILHSTVITSVGRLATETCLLLLSIEYTICSYYKRGIQVKKPVKYL